MLREFFCCDLTFLGKRGVERSVFKRHSTERIYIFSAMHLPTGVPVHEHFTFLTWDLGASTECDSRQRPTRVRATVPCSGDPFPSYPGPRWRQTSLLPSLVFLILPGFHPSGVLAGCGSLWSVSWTWARQRLQGPCQFQHILLQYTFQRCLRLYPAFLCSLVGWFLWICILLYCREQKLGGGLIVKDLL